MGRILGSVFQCPESRQHPRAASGSERLGSGPVLSWYEFAALAAEMINLTTDMIETTTYEEMGLPAPRPHYSALRCLTSERLGIAPLRDWREGLSEMCDRI